MENEVLEMGTVTVTNTNVADMGDYVVRHFLVEKVR